MRFCAAPVDRASALERRNKDLASSPNARFLVVYSRKILTAENGDLQWLTRQQVEDLAFHVDTIYLGPLVEPLPGLPETDVFVVDLGFLNETQVTPLGTLRSGRELLMSKATDADVTVAGIALAMADWHQSAKFEGRTGKATVSVEGGAKRQVEPGGAKVYPRTDPVAIGLIVSPDHQRCLLGRSHKYPTGMYICLSGFVDICEPVEEAFKREAFEEAGVRIHSVSLVASQPWPIGRAGSCELMLACKAVAHSEHIQVNMKEIEDARWFTRAEVGQMLQQQHPQGLFVPPRFAIANKLITDFVSPGKAQFGSGSLHRAPFLATLAAGFLVGFAFARLRSHL